VSEGPPVSVSYALTPAGQALLPVLDALAEWAAENLPA
jgi:DNA-binding HxlR family transcriptional regulator